MEMLPAKYHNYKDTYLAETKAGLSNYFLCDPPDPFPWLNAMLSLLMQSCKLHKEYRETYFKEAMDNIAQLKHEYPEHINAVRTKFINDLAKVQLSNTETGNNWIITGN